MEEYEISSSYQEARYKAICAVLSTMGITIEDFAGVITINKDGKKLATLDIREMESD